MILKKYTGHIINEYTGVFPKTTNALQEESFF